MLYDLNVAWTPSTPPARLEQTLRMSAQLGYDVVALNHTLSAPIPADVTNPIPADVVPPSTARAPLPKLLRRVTVNIADVSVHHRLPALAAAYDVVAVRPLTERAFQAACLTMAEPALISLDLTTHFPFHFRARPVAAAVARGVRFEICYAQGLTGRTATGRGGAVDARARALFIGNVVNLVRAARGGRGIVVSSEAAGPLELRAPADVVNLLALWGLGPERGTEALGAASRAVVVNEALRRRGFRGVVDIVQTAASGRDEEKKKKGEMEEEEDEAGAGAAGGGSVKGKQGVKRKGAGDTDPDKPMSKRQAKKLKRAQMQQTAAHDGGA